MKTKNKEFIELPEALQKIFNDTKDTPMEEPELYEIIKKRQAKEASVLDIVVHLLDIEALDTYEADVLIAFGKQIEERVVAFIDVDGYYKTTSNFDEWQPVKPSKAFAILKQEKENIQLSKKLFKDVDWEDKKSVDKIPQSTFDKVEEARESFKKMIIEASGIANYEELDKWEQDLCIAMTASSAGRFDNSALGKLFKDS